MLLLPRPLAIVSRTIKDKVAWLHFLERQVDGKSVKLVRLIPSVKFETKIFAKIVDDLTHQGTAVKEERSVVERLSRVVVPSRVRDSEVLYAAIDEFLPQLLFESRIGLIDGRLLCHIVPVLDFIFLIPSEALEVSLEPATFLVRHSAEAKKISSLWLLAFFLLWFSDL